MTPTGGESWLWEGRRGENRLTPSMCKAQIGTQRMCDIKIPRLWGAAIRKIRSEKTPGGGKRQWKVENHATGRGSHARTGGHWGLALSSLWGCAVYQQPWLPLLGCQEHPSPSFRVDNQKYFWCCQMSPGACGGQGDEISPMWELPDCMRSFL